MIRRTLLYIIALFFAMSVQAQDIIRVRNCRPQLSDSHIILSRRTQSRDSGVNPYIGDRRQLVVLAAFKDRPFVGNEQVTMQKWNNILNTENYINEPYIGSLHDYFYEQSYGQLRLYFDMHYVVADSVKKYSSTFSDDENSKYLVQDVIDSIRSQVDDWSVYDWDGDGYVNQLMIIFAGIGMDEGGGSKSIWPHQWWLSEHEQCEPITVSCDGKDYLIDSYCCTAEKGLNDSSGTFGTLCHEYSHCLGLPDFYYSSTSYVNEWDLMDYGNRNGGGYIPCGYSAYERMYLGWLNPVELTSDTVITDLPALADSAKAFIIRNDGHPDEYYLVENRQKKGWDAQLPGSGILVFHVDYDEDVFVNGYVNSSRQQRYLIIPANDATIPVPLRKDVSGWAYPYDGNDKLTNTSVPAATLNNANKDGQLLMSKPITSMAVNNGLASFSFSPVPTGIGTIGADRNRGTWYYMDGRKISDSPTAPGLYIHDGKLELIR